MFEWLRPRARASAARIEPVLTRHAASVGRSEAYKAAKLDRLTNDWPVRVQSANAAVRTSIRRLRARSRLLAQNDDYMRGFLVQLESNVIGAAGIRLQSQAQTASGAFDLAAQARVEEAWRRWGEQGSCTIDGRSSWLDVQSLVIKGIARDGEILVRLITGPDAQNGFGFALQVIEADHLDEELIKTLSDDRQIYAGVEVDRWFRPVAYHLLRQHPGDETYLGRVGRHGHVRVPASEILHLYISDRAQQWRGVPWGHAAMTRLNQLSGYEDAELVASRVAASKMGIWTSPDGQPFGDGQDEQGHTLQDAEPGQFEMAPAGYDLKMFDPQHPNAGYEAFIKAVLRGVASGLGVSYATLANDLRDVNFSSIRHGSISERDMWRKLQFWLVQVLCQPVFNAWLAPALDFGQLGLARLSPDRLRAVKWQPRGWQWVDPKNESEANEKQVDMGTKTLTAVAAEQGRDLVEVLAERRRELDAAKAMGVPLRSPGAKEADEGEGDDAAEDDGNDQDEDSLPRSDD